MQSINLVITLVTLLSFNLAFIAGLYMLGQQWVRTLAQGTTLILLPFITFVVTSVISRDISLALGMVGALSIVRFRNPVRSPLELVAYFGCIGMGICASVSIKWLSLLGALLVVTLIAIIALRSTFNKIFKVDLFTASFSEGSQLATLEITSNEPIPELANSELLSKVFGEGDDVSYGLISRDNGKLLEIYNLVESRQSVIRRELRLI